MGLERSLAFTSLLEVSNTFGRITAGAGCEVTTALLADYNALPVAATTPTMLEYARTWLARYNDLACMECGGLVGQEHGWGCDLVLYGEKKDTDPVTLEDCENV